MSEESSNPIKNPFENADEDSDVRVKVGDVMLHLHSWSLSHNSPVFKVMLNGNFKEGLTKKIEIKEKQPEYVIEMFKYFYPKTVPRVTENTNFKELLPLCREYQLEWLKERFEEYLDNIWPLLKGGYANRTHCEKIVTTLWLTEEYNLKQNLKEKLLSVCMNSYYEYLKDCDDWKRISISSLESILIHHAESEQFSTFLNSVEDWNRISIKAKYQIADKRIRDLIRYNSGEYNLIDTFMQEKLLAKAEQSEEENSVPAKKKK